MEWYKLLSYTRERALLGESYSPSNPPEDQRSEIERDYGRAVFSTAVRRLQDKAQVFPLEPNDFVRTRLTHSLEVSTLSRSLAKEVATYLLQDGDIDDQQARDIETVAATVGLLHDIGNPPFGHAGEAAMQGWFADLLQDESAISTALGGASSQLRQDFAMFDGNPQTFRLVSRLQVLADRFGLNLTAASLSVGLKYVSPSHEVVDDDQQRSKPGYFASEQDLVAVLREHTGTGTARHPIAYLVEAADDMTYSCADLEDAVRKEIISWDLLRSEVLQDDSSQVALFDKCDKYLVTNASSLTGKSLDEARTQLFRTFAMYEHVTAAANEFHRSLEGILGGQYKYELLSSGDSAGLLASCKRVAKEYVYRSPAVLRLELKGRSIIEQLLTLFWQGVSEAPSTDEQWQRTFPGKIYGLLSDNYRRAFEEDCTTYALQRPVEYARLQLIADYVAGMTDHFALSLAHELALTT